MSKPLPSNVLFLAFTTLTERDNFRPFPTNIPQLPVAILFDELGHVRGSWPRAEDDLTEDTFKGMTQKQVREYCRELAVVNAAANVNIDTYVVRAMEDVQMAHRYIISALSQYAVTESLRVRLYTAGVPTPLLRDLQANYHNGMFPVWAVNAPVRASVRAKKKTKAVVSRSMTGRAERLTVRQLRMLIKGLPADSIVSLIGNGSMSILNRETNVQYVHVSTDAHAYVNFERIYTKAKKVSK